ncbi:MAG: DUF1700 domain-containing protein [Clostridium sp.]|nr:DUF1700 domain-containing protein [Clostridium sp.]
MSKEIFLEELRGYLQILEDQEQEDILEEYAQHIDMKLQKGLSEEEAIKDFGPVKELAAEILEAYHVKPEFPKKTAFTKLPGIGSGNRAAGKSFFVRAWHFLKEKITAAGKATRRGIRQSLRWIGEKGKAFGQWFMKPFRKRKDGREGFSEAEEEEIFLDAMEDEALPALPMVGGASREKGQSKNTMGGKGKMNHFFKSMGRGLIAFWRMLAAFCGWWLRLFWNMAWLIFAIFCAVMAMIVLMGIGAMIVLLLKGYPIIGLFLVCLGGLLCFGSLAAGAFSLLIRKEKPETSAEKEKLGKVTEKEERKTDTEKEKSGTGIEKENRETEKERPETSTEKEKQEIEKEKRGASTEKRKQEREREKGKSETGTEKEKWEIEKERPGTSTEKEKRGTRIEEEKLEQEKGEVQYE